MNNDKLKSFFISHQKTYEADISRALMDNIMAIPENESRENLSLSVDTLSLISAWQIKFSLSRLFTFLMPRVSGLVAACILGLYFGGFDKTMAADDVKYFGAEYAEVVVFDVIMGTEDLDVVIGTEELNE
jgi:hypothetical protein